MKRYFESSRLEFSNKFLANNFTLSDAEDNTSVPLSRAVIADLLLLGSDRFFLFMSILKVASATFLLVYF